MAGALWLGHFRTPSVAFGATFPRTPSVAFGATFPGPPPALRATSPQCHYGVAWRGWLSTSLPILMGVWLTLVLPLRWA